MYGILLESIVAYIKKAYSEEKWQLIRVSARIEHENFGAHQVYAETLIPKLVDACEKHLGLPKEDILITFGKTYVDFISHYGYDKVLKVVGRNFRDFLNGLDNIHEYLRFSYPKLKPPSFFVEQETRDGLLLHYRSRRRYAGFTHYVMGMLKAVGRTFYKQEISITILKQEATSSIVHVIYQLNFDNFAHQGKLEKLNTTLVNLSVRMEVFYELFPFHILLDRDLTVRSIGKSLQATVDNIIGYDVTQVFSLKKPLIDFNWDSISSRTNTMFELSTIDPIRKKDEVDDGDYFVDENGRRRSSVVSEDGDAGTFLRLKGQMLFMKEWDSMIFIGTAVLQDLDVLLSTGLYLNDLSMHDNSRELVLAGAQQGVELKLIMKQEQIRSKQLDDTIRKLGKEMQKGRELVYKMLPKQLANEVLNRSESNDTDVIIPDNIDLAQQATILICSVQQTDEKVDDSQYVKEVIRIHQQIEFFTERYGFYKVETTNNSLMAVGGIPTASDAVEDNACFLAKKIARFASTLPLVKLSIGIHTGTAVYAVIGGRLPRLCVFGPTVLFVHRLQEFCKAESQQTQLLVSEATKARLAKDSQHKFLPGPVISHKREDFCTHLLQVG